MTETPLFDLESVRMDSPRLKEIKAHDIQTHFSSHCEEPWMAVPMKAAIKKAGEYLKGNENDIASVTASVGILLDEAGMLFMGRSKREVEDAALEFCRSSGEPKTLKLTLKRKWFDMIASGEKREEYRVPGKWIMSRLEGREYDRIEFKNGYGPNVPTMEVEYLGWSYSFGKPQWGGGGERGKPLATIYLGRVLTLRNAKHALP